MLAQKNRNEGRWIEFYVLLHLCNFLFSHAKRECTARTYRRTRVQTHASEFNKCKYHIFNIMYHYIIIFSTSTSTSLYERFAWICLCFVCFYIYIFLLLENSHIFILFQIPFQINKIHLYINQFFVFMRMQKHLHLG